MTTPLQTRCASSPERGAAMVEFALLLPVFVMLVLGALTGGIALNHKIDVTHSAREGARYGATLAQTQCKPAANCNGLTWAQAVQRVVVDRAFGDVTSAGVCVALVAGSPGTVLNGDSDYITGAGGASSCFNDGGTDASTRVQIKVTRTGDSINAVFFKIPVTLMSQAVERFEQ